MSEYYTAHDDEDNLAFEEFFIHSWCDCDNKSREPKEPAIISRLILRVKAKLRRNGAI